MEAGIRARLTAAPDATAPELRKFGLVMGVALAVMFGGVLPWLFNRAFPMWPHVAGGIFVVIALVAPRALAWPHRLWMLVGHGLGWFNSRLILSVLFFVLIFPIGLVMRLFGRTAMLRRRDAQATTYRIASSRTPDAKSMERPF